MKSPKSTNSPMTANIILKSKKSRQRKLGCAATSNEQRSRLIDLISRTNSVRIASKIIGLNESTAKSIYYNYVRSGNFLRKNNVGMYRQILL